LLHDQVSAQARPLSNPVGTTARAPAPDRRDRGLARGAAGISRGGLATAQAAAGQADAQLHEAVICYGAGGGPELPDGKSSDTSAHWNVCCALCVPSAPATHNNPASDELQSAEASTPPLSSSFPIMIARRAVRAGQSQAPPGMG
jgi:hypothetical protein